MIDTPRGGRSFVDLVAISRRAARSRWPRLAVELPDSRKLISLSDAAKYIQTSEGGS
jgi:hypothetical protein